MKIGRLVVLALTLLTAAPGQVIQDWSHYARIGGHGLERDSAERIVRSATETGVFGIEVDNDITGRYESFLEPATKLNALREVSRKAHEAGNYVFVYIAGTECITANAVSTSHTMAKEHPDWLQRNLKGEPALFGGGVAFWVRKGDEDVWVTPFAPEWRKTYMERVRQIAGTGVDGVYVDIPYWMTHFEGWTDSWASFDDYTVAAFEEKTGLNARTDLKLGDYGNASFRRWIDFRIEALSGFMREIDANVKAVNPKCKTIAEIYPGIDQEAVRVGSDVYDMYRAVDVIAHEFNPGERAAARTPLNWLESMIGMYSFRAFAQGKPSWMLTYSWDGDKGAAPGESMQNLAMSQLMAGTNTWDARSHVMSGSNDFATRTRIFSWIKKNEKTFFLPREPVRPIGIYFSDKSRNYFSREFIRSYQGMLALLLQGHLEFHIVTPRTLDSFAGDVLILPETRSMSNRELDSLSLYIASGRTLVVTGETGGYDETGAARQANPVHKLLGITNAGAKKVSASGHRIAYYPKCPGASYWAQLEKEFNNRAAKGDFDGSAFDGLKNDFIREILQMSGHVPVVAVDASPFVSTQIARVEGKLSVFLANFKGLAAGTASKQIPESNVKITFRTGRNGTVHLMPFLGEPRPITGTWKDGALTCVIPSVEKGAVVWLE